MQKFRDMIQMTADVNVHNGKNDKRSGQNEAKIHPCISTGGPAGHDGASWLQ